MEDLEEGTYFIVRTCPVCEGEGLVASVPDGGSPYVGCEECEGDGHLLIPLEEATPEELLAEWEGATERVERVRDAYLKSVIRKETSAIREEILGVVNAHRHHEFTGQGVVSAPVYPLPVEEVDRD